MPSTYTTNLGIEKPATGEQSGTWGDTVNLNYDLFDQAINGVQSVTLPAAGSSGSPRVLAITDGTVSEGRNKFIEFVDGGDLGATAYVQLTPNDAEKVVHIRNSLSGNRAVIVFQGTYNASNDFEIPNGKDVVLKFDGAGTGAVVEDVFVDLQVTGLTAGTADINGGTLDGVVIGGASAAAATVTDLTASGTVDFSGATVSDLGTVTTADIDGGTIDGVTIGGSTPAAGDFTTLAASDNLDVYASSDGIVARFGSSDVNRQATWETYDSGSAGSGHRLDAPSILGEWDFRTGGTSRLLIDSSGNVGIGTTSPAATLDVTGTARVDDYIFTRNAVSSFTSGQTISVTAPTAVEGSLYLAIASRHTGTANRSTEFGVIVFSGDGNSTYSQIVAGTGLSLTTSGATVSLQNTTGTATIHLAILGLN